MPVLEVLRHYDVKCLSIQIPCLHVLSKLRNAKIITVMYPLMVVVIYDNRLYGLHWSFLLKKIMSVDEFIKRHRILSCYSNNLPAPVLFFCSMHVEHASLFQTHIIWFSCWNHKFYRSGLRTHEFRISWNDVVESWFCYNVVVSWFCCKTGYGTRESRGLINTKLYTNHWS